MQEWIIDRHDQNGVTPVKRGFSIRLLDRWRKTQLWENQNVVFIRRKVEVTEDVSQVPSVNADWTR